MTRRLAFSLGTVAVALAASPSALAVTRYVSPTGSGVACTSAAPCSLVYAADTALSSRGDEVVLARGTYTLSASLYVNNGLTVRGEGEPSETVITGNPSFLVYIYPAVTLRNVTIDSTAGDGGAALAAYGRSHIDRVIVKRPTGAGEGIRPLTGGVATLITNTFVSTDSGTAISAESVGSPSDGYLSARLDHVTAVSNGGGLALSVVSSANRPVSVTVTNSILSSSGANDLRLGQGGTAFTADIYIGNTFYRSGAAVLRPTSDGTLLSMGGNSLVTPVFVDRAAGNLRQASSSPTINAASTQLGPLVDHDIDGDPRPLDARADVGADEFVPAPTLGTPAIKDLAATSAIVEVNVDGRGAPGTVTVDYGTGGALNKSSSVKLSDSTARVPLTALPPSSAISYKVTVTTKGGSASSTQGTLTTPAPLTNTVTQPVTKTVPPTAPTLTKLAVVRGRLSGRASQAGVLRVEVRAGTRTIKTLRVDVKKGLFTVPLGKLGVGAYKVRAVLNALPSRAVTRTFRVTSTR